MKIAAHSVDIFALKLGEKRGETVIISFDSDRFENGFDILGARGGVSTKGEEKVCREVLHFDVGSEKTVSSQ